MPLEKDQLKKGSWVKATIIKELPELPFVLGREAVKLQSVSSASSVEASPPVILLKDRFFHEIKLKDGHIYSISEKLVLATKGAAINEEQNVIEIQKEIKEKPSGNFRFFFENKPTEKPTEREDACIANTFRQRELRKKRKQKNALLNDQFFAEPADEQPAPKQQKTAEVATSPRHAILSDTQYSIFKELRTKLEKDPAVGTSTSRAELLNICYKPV